MLALVCSCTLLVLSLVAFSWANLGLLTRWPHSLGLLRGDGFLFSPFF